MYDKVKYYLTYCITQLTPCNRLDQQANIRMCLHGLLLFVDNKSVAICQQTCCKLIVINRLAATHVKISQLVAGLQTSCQQVVFAWLVPSCLQVWNKLLATGNNLVEIIKLVTMLFQQACYYHDRTILLQSGGVNLVTFLLYHDCIRLVKTTL